jgi:hypothetical protein
LLADTEAFDPGGRNGRPGVGWLEAADGEDPVTWGTFGPHHLPSHTICLEGCNGKSFIELQPGVIELQRAARRSMPLSCGNGGGVTEGTPTPTFGTTIRIAHSHQPSCLSRKAGDLRFF